MYIIKLKLKVQRLNAHMTQKILAEKCHMNQSYISRIERNIKSPTIATLEKLSNALEIHPCDLLDIYKIL